MRENLQPHQKSHLTNHPKPKPNQEAASKIRNICNRLKDLSNLWVAEIPIPIVIRTVTKIQAAATNAIAIPTIIPPQGIVAAQTRYTDQTKLVIAAITQPKKVSKGKQPEDSAAKEPAASETASKSAAIATDKAKPGVS